MLVVSDTSPITNLIQVGHLDILEQLFGQIIIPEKVYQELTVYENHKQEIDARRWMITMTAVNREEVKILEAQLDSGEAEAIVLAKQLNALLIVDEKKGRKAAEEYGLKIIGLLGVLIQGKRRGYLEELKTLLDKLIEEADFRISKQLYTRIVEEVNEAE